MIPNTTPTPNIIFNGLMRKMTDTEFRIVMLVVRATLGWEADKETGMRKTEDWISSRQLKEKTGRQSGALSKAIDKCVLEDWIEARSKNGEILDTKGKRKGKNIYFRLGKSILFTTSSESEEVVVKDKKDYQTSSESELVLVKRGSTSSETANAETANAESGDYKRNTIQNKNITKDIAPQAAQEDINKYIDLFKEVNPSYERLFANKTQRAAIGRLIKKFGEEQLAAMIEALPKVNKMSYMPITTTPYELEMNIGKIKGKIEQEKSKAVNKHKKIEIV